MNPPTEIPTFQAKGASVAGFRPGLRVAHVIHSGGFYGAEKVVYDLAREQASGGEISPCLIALLDQGLASNELADRASAGGIPVIRINVVPGISAGGLADYARALRTAGITLAHSHGYKATLFHLASRWSGFHRLPLLVTAHGYPKGSGTWKATFYRWLDIACLGFAEGVVAVSGDMGRYLSRRNPACRPFLIPNGIPAGLAARGAHPLLKQLSSEGVGAGDRTPIIGSAGRLVPMKNHALLIRAYASVRAATPCRLVILGEGPLRAELESLWRDLIPGEPVRIYPFQSDVLEWMADMDVFALPSRDGEGLPIALLEAGLLGRAVACSDSGGIPEVVRDRVNGRIFPKEDLEALSLALEDLLRSPGDRAAYGMALRREILRDHDIGVTHGRYLEAYAQAMAKP